MKRIWCLSVVIMAVAMIAYMEFRMDRTDAAIREVAGAVGRLEAEQQKPQAQTTKYTDDDLRCMALNIFHEAGIESGEGMIAVGQVTLNRVRSGRWGKTICEVVYAKAQFSWTLYERNHVALPKGRLWADSMEAAAVVLNGAKIKTLNKSLFYHTDYIKVPKWADDKNKITQIGQHIFYTKDKKAKTKVDSRLKML